MCEDCTGNKLCNKCRCKRYYESHKGDYRRRDKEWNRLHPEARHLAYLNTPIEVIRERNRSSQEKRRAAPVNRLKQRYYATVRSIVEGTTVRRCKYTKYLGMQPDDLRTYLLKQLGGVLPENYEIDHMIPMTYAKTEEEVHRLNHYSNLQVVPSETNRKKNTVTWLI